MSEFRLRGMEEVEREIERASKYLVGIPRGTERAVMHAFNRAVSSGKKAGSRAARKIYTLPDKRIQKTFRIRRARREARAIIIAQPRTGIHTLGNPPPDIRVPKK